MDIINNYKPIGWQQKFHREDWRYAALVGGKGCVRESTRIWTTEGLKAIGDIRGPQVYPSMGKEGFQLSLGASPFPKGKANLYRVVHEHGEFVASGHHLAFCGGHKSKYVRVDQMEVGQSFAGVGASFAANPLLTTEAPSLQEYARDVLRLSQIGVDFEYRYLECIRRYGQQLLEALGICQFSVPFLSGAQRFDPVSLFSSISHEGVRMGRESLRNLLDLLFDPRPKLCSLDHSLDLFSDVANSSCSKDIEYISLGYQSSSKSHESVSCHRKELGQTQFVQECISDSDVSSRLTSSFSTILSIEKLPKEEWYWDLQVRDTNNYISEDGVVHHNSGKTFGAVQELLACALEYPGTTYVIGRKTLPSLRDSTWKAFLSILDHRLIAEVTKNPMRVEIVNGSEFLGRPLDEMKKFDSMEIAGWLIDEADETEEEMWKTLKDRTRQMLEGPNGEKIVPRYRGILSLNPTEEDHWIPQFFLNPQKPENHKIYFASTYDNIENLPPGYIEQMKAQYTPDMQQRVIYGMFGKVHKGRPVFPQFSRGNYVWSIEREEKATMFRGWDFGYNTPACVWFQFINGQLRVLGELYGKRQYLDDFIKEALKYQGELFPAHRMFEDFCDPHGADEKDTGKTSLDIMREFGIYPKYRRQTIAEGIKAIKWLLDTQMPNGEPCFYINGRAKRLVEAFRGGYYREDGEERPCKDGYFDHGVDALRYGVTHLVTRFRANQMSKIDSTRAKYVHPVTGRVIEL
jgi:hypothetical protein